MCCTPTVFFGFISFRVSLVCFFRACTHALYPGGIQGVLPPLPGKPFAFAHSRISSCPFSFAHVRNLQSQGQPFARAHFKISTCPFIAVLDQIFSSPGAPFACAH
jgi:hypothetical protein